MLWEQILLFGLLGPFAISDLRQRRVWWPLAVIAGGLGWMLHVAAGEADIRLMLPALVPGILLLLLAKLPHPQVGSGDGAALLACALIQGMQVYRLLFLALVFCALVSALLLMMGKIRRRDTLPFVPFLLAAQICLCLPLSR